MKSFNLDSNSLIISTFFSIFILFNFIFSLKNFFNLQFLNTLISSILFCCKSNSFNSGKFAFLNTSIFFIKLVAKFNIFNFGKLTLAKISISEILLSYKIRLSNSLKSTFDKTFKLEILFPPKVNTFKFINILELNISIVFKSRSAKYKYYKFLNLASFKGLISIITL